MDERLRDAAADLVARYAQARLMLATAESCTGGMVAAAITEIAGSSAVLDRGFVTYSNEAKAEMLGVPPALVEVHGAVSAEVARAMAEGAISASRADAAVAITGIAGPGGGSEAKPVGLVWFASARRGRPAAAEEVRFEQGLGRAGIRIEAALHALGLLRAALR